jgi:EPS-associated MarR family transcriptional regulator
MTSRQSHLQEDTTFRVLRLLEREPDISQRELADRLGLSLGGLNYCLKALMDKGLVKLENFSASRHKLGYVYILTPMGLAAKAALTGRFLKRKMAEYEALKAEIESLRDESAVGGNYPSLGMRSLNFTAP